MANIYALNGVCQDGNEDFFGNVAATYDWKVTPEYQPHNYHQPRFQVEGKLQAQVSNPALKN